ncbi:ABC transporter permease [Pseudonocardia sp. CA-142604]|uniref:ABC transporter permease n=1 Tax=Pseudonocardia sp. CA-142604 TaxID=3240024 RepID=UPI003D93ACC3
MTAAGHPTIRSSRFTERIVQRIRRDRILLVLAVPGILIILLFRYVPLLGNVIAFQDFQPFLGISESSWVGFDNFRILADPLFLNALTNTLIITLIQVVLVFPAPIIVALLLNSMLAERWKRLVQSILYMPHFLSWVMVVAITQQLLGGTGIINNALRGANLATVNIIGNEDWFFALITSQVIWKDTGWATILFLAALSRIDVGLYEAASVDGASRWRQLWHITLPGLRSIIILLLILRLGEALNVGFEQILLQQPAVGIRASEVLDTYVYNNGIIGGNWGAAAAVGLLKGIVGVVLVLGANKVAHMFGEPGLYDSRSSR